MHSGHFVGHRRQRNVRYLLGEIFRPDGLVWRCQLAVGVLVERKLTVAARRGAEAFLLQCDERCFKKVLISDSQPFQPSDVMSRGSRCLQITVDILLEKLLGPAAVARVLFRPVFCQVSVAGTKR